MRNRDAMNPQVSTPSVPEADDLDVELEAVFDNNDPPTPPTTTTATAATTTATAATTTATAATTTATAATTTPPPPRTILEALVANKARLSMRAANLASDITKVTSTPSVPPAPSPLAAALRHARAPAPTPQSRARAARNAKNAFRVIGSEARLKKGGSANQITTYAYVDHDVTNMSLRDTPFPQARLKALFEHVRRVDIAHIQRVADDIRAGNMPHFVVFGCLVRKCGKRETKTGAKYAVWSVCNMPRAERGNVDATVVTLLLFEGAFERFHTQVEGGVFAIRAPSVLPPRESGGGDDPRVGGGAAAFSGYCLKVSKEDAVIPIGVCADFGVCEADVAKGGACGNWYDRNRLGMCVAHTRLKRRKMGMGERMDVNNAVRPGTVVDLMRGVAGPRNISAQGGGRRTSEGEGLVARDEVAEARGRREREKLLALRKHKQIHNLRLKDRATLHAGREGSAGFMRPMLEKGVARRIHSRVGKRDEAQRDGTQGAYDAAVHTLLKLGFVLCGDGSLQAPAKAEGGVVLRRGNKQICASLRRPAQVEKDGEQQKATDICLSEESDDE